MVRILFLYKVQYTEPNNRSPRHLHRSDLFDDVERKYLTNNIIIWIYSLLVPNLTFTWNCHHY